MSDREPTPAYDLAAVRCSRHVFLSSSLPSFPPNYACFYFFLSPCCLFVFISLFSLRFFLLLFSWFSRIFLFACQLCGETSDHFDIGDMAFDATFEHEYAEQEVSGAVSSRLEAMTWCLAS